jgi:Mg-chelatase subunit ChlD
MTTKKKAPKKAKKQTHIAIVLDRSGSMSSIHKQTVDGLNQQFEAIKKAAKAAGNTNVSLIQFDTVIETRIDSVKPNELIEWAMTDFQPRGGTALYDGVWSAINHLKAKPSTDDTAYLICVISDGEENSSHEVSQPIMTAEISKLQAQGNWTFTYLLANVDINKARITFNASANNISTFNSTVVGSSVAYTNNAVSIGNYLGTRGTTSGSYMNTAYVAYTDEQKHKMARAK